MEEFGQERVFEAGGFGSCPCQIRDKNARFLTVKVHPFDSAQGRLGRLARLAETENYPAEVFDEFDEMAGVVFDGKSHSSLWEGFMIS